ncbi:MAG: VapC toxin family PIN domain ribonuclease [Akkermansiaceae bacterium]
MPHTYSPFQTAIPQPCADMVLVDSCCWLEASRKDGRIEVKAAVKHLLDEFLALLCGPVELEVLGGARKDERAKMKKYFDILPYRASDHKVWRLAMQTAWTLRDAGLTIPWNDTIIATIACQYGYRVYSINKHFPVMSKVLGFALYKPGYGGAYNPD